MWEKAQRAEDWMEIVRDKIGILQIITGIYNMGDVTYQYYYHLLSIATTVTT